MNLFKVSEILLEEVISHRSISPTAIRMNWIIDGAARPVIVFDTKTNVVTHMPDHHHMQMKHRDRLAAIMRRCCFVNIH